MRQVKMAVSNMELSPHLAHSPEEIQACFPVIQVLRPHLSERQFLAQVNRQIQQGYRLAYITDENKTLSVAGYRYAEFLAWGKVLYIDDLCTLPEARGKGLAGLLLKWLIQQARLHDCLQVHLDSGHTRHDAHRLYLNHGFILDCHHFKLHL